VERAGNAPIFLSIIPAFVSVFLQFVILRPNRIADGTGYRLLEFGPSAAAWALLLLPLAGALLFVVLGAPGSPAGNNSPTGKWSPTGTCSPTWRLGILALWSVTVTVLPWLLFQRGTAVLTQRGMIGELGRVTPGAGFWLLLLSALVGWHELSRVSRASQNRSQLVFPVAAVTAFVLVALLVVQPAFRSVSYVVEYTVRSERFIQALFEHVLLSGTAVGLACLIGVPAGMAAYRHPRLRETILDATSTIQTIPSLAMFGLLIAPLSTLSRAVPALRRAGVSGVGVTPALIALTLYALLPVVRNTVTGLLVVPLEIRESGRAMGMNRRQLFRMVEVPIALPVLLGGVRTAAVQAVGNTTVAGLIGAGGLGWFVFQGLGQAATDLVVLGVIPIVILAVLVDRLFGVLQRISNRGRVEVEVAG
jgi:osmoprotectant transport system permease protein